MCVYPMHGRRKHFYSGEAIGGIKTIIVQCASSRGWRGHAPPEKFQDFRYSQIESGAIFGAKYQLQ